MQIEISTENYDGSHSVVAGDHLRCVGSVRGWCGTRHRTLEAAHACRHRDMSRCAIQGGYSDRYVYVYDGDARQLPDVENVEIVGGSML